jgi:hypothetical protein
MILVVHPVIASITRYNPVESNNNFSTSHHSLSYLVYTYQYQPTSLAPYHQTRPETFIYNSLPNHHPLTHSDSATKLAPPTRLLIHPN